MVPVSPSDYYSVFELKPSFAVDLPELEKRFYRLAKTLHPDRFTNELDLAVKHLALEKMSFLNQAYQTLKSPDLRRDYLLEFFKVPTAQAALPADLAEEWFDVQDEPGSPGFIRFGEKLSEREKDLHLQIQNLEVEFDAQGSQSTLAKISALIQDVAYLQSLGRDVKKYGKA